MWIFLLVALALSLGLFYSGKNWLAWALPGAVVLLGWLVTGVSSVNSFAVIAVGFVLLAVVTGVPSYRRNVLTRQILPRIAPILPKMSDTERIAIEAGTVWWESEFFSGDPDWRSLLNFHPHVLSPKERAFVDGPVEEVCQMVSDWETNRSGDLSKEVWDFLKKEGFLGMIIPEEYGGLGFSAAAHSAVITKLSSRSVALSVTAMVPNSLGPAELLLHYGTEEQKDHYLPRLARGEDVPAFALTEPEAGSDAGSMQSTGVVTEGTYQGEKTLGIRLNWDKRYITLAPVATVLGLAFKLEDPDGLLGDQKELGITCALVPTDLPGIEIGERHDPLGCAFMNGPTHGKDVFVPIDAIIGGREMAGKGWLMLMQSLAAGRGISLPSMASGAAQLATRATSAYSTVRKQFKLSIGKFEGIQEPLTRIAGMTYAMEAARSLTVGAVDAGEKPSVTSAIVKCYLTEGMRSVTNDAMDIVGGAGICRGPRNILAEGYSALPIGITVEGANILTRSMIIFGQGAIRCHPFVQKEMRAAETRNLEEFDQAFFGHVGFVFQNIARSLLLGLSDGLLADAPVTTPAAPYYRKLTRMSAAFAMASDVAMGTLGGALKRKEAITGRLADVLSWMYLAAATLKRFHMEGSRKEDFPLMSWFVEHALWKCQDAYLDVARNMPLKPAGWFLRFVAFPFGAQWKKPSDKLTQKVARAVLDSDELRERLTPGLFFPAEDELGLGQLEATLGLIRKAEPVHAKVQKAVKGNQLERKPAATLVQRALDAGLISSEEKELVDSAEAARSESIAVDSFGKKAYAEMSA